MSILRRFFVASTAMLMLNAIANAQDANTILDGHLARVDSIKKFTCYLDMVTMNEDRGRSTFYSGDHFVLRAICEKQKLDYFAMGTKVVDLGDDKSMLETKRTWQQTLIMNGPVIYRFGFGTWTDGASGEINKMGLPQKPLHRKIHPLVLPLFPFSEIQDTELTRVVDTLLSSKMLASETNKQGNIIGRWMILPHEKSIVEMEFSRLHGDNPVKVIWFRAKAGIPDHKYNESDIEWAKSSDEQWLPKHITMKSINPTHTTKIECTCCWLTGDALPEDYFTSPSIDPKQLRDNRPHFFGPFAKRLKRDFEIAEDATIRMPTAAKPK
jgi:hypothetical protein